MRRIPISPRRLQSDDWHRLMDGRQRFVVAVLAIVMGLLAVTAMGLILLHTRPISADKIETQNLQ